MITIIDYQMGNLRSVQKAFESVGREAVISSDPSEIGRAESVVLPGVGAFRDAIAELRRRDLVGPIHDVIDAGRPFLGICLGLQLLFDVSYERGEYEGLGIVPGKVIKFDLPPQYKVPHMGWNTVTKAKPVDMLDSVGDGVHMYFVHSYYVVPDDPAVTALHSDYGGDFCAMIARDNLFATQFHPEKSQADGLQLLKGFGELGALTT
ncbi:MAG: imidazole glycerol phosphate synthase subunit HisH [Planctomycetota bacterium]